MSISAYSTTAASNNAAVPDGFPEGQAPSTLNNCWREVMASAREWAEDADWTDYGHTPTQTSGTTFTVVGDHTAVYEVNQAIRCEDSSMLYGWITASSYSAPDTTVTVALDSGSLSGSLSAVAIGRFGVSDGSLAQFGQLTEASGTQPQYLTEGDLGIITEDTSNVALFLANVANPTSQAYRRRFVIKNERSSGNIWMRQAPALTAEIHGKNALAWKIPAGCAVMGVGTTDGGYKLISKVPASAALRRSCHFVEFDGSTSELYRNGGTAWFSNFNDSSTGTLSFWFRPDDVSNRGLFWHSRGLRINILAFGNLSVTLSNITLSRQYSAQSTTAFTAGNIYHVAMSWNMNAAASSKTLLLYINGVSETLTSVNDASPAFQVEWSGQPGNGAKGFRLGHDGVSDPFDGAMGEIFLSTSQFLDLTSPSNLALLYTANSEPADLGATGTGPGLGNPSFYLNRAAEYFGEDSGSFGNDLTVQGTFTDAVEAP